jgi:hypothetical protein
MIFRVFKDFFFIDFYFKSILENLSKNLLPLMNGVRKPPLVWSGATSVWLNDYKNNNECVLNLHACMLNLHVCVSKGQGVWYGYNSAQCVYSTRIRLVACQNRTYVCSNHTHECSNHKQSTKITPRLPKSHAWCHHHTHDVKITLVRVV